MLRIDASSAGRALPTDHRRDRRRTPSPARARAIGALAPAWAALVLLGALAFLPSPAAAAGSRLSGRVLDSDTQRPIAGADVELANTSGGQGYFRARTNAQGEFSMDRIPADRWYTLTVGAKDYAEFVLCGMPECPVRSAPFEKREPLSLERVIRGDETLDGGRPLGAVVRP